MKITNVKAKIAKLFTVSLLAGAVAIAAPGKAQAQVAFGVRVGPAYPVRGPVYGPYYHRPVYVAPPAYGFYGGYYGRPYGWDHRYYRRGFYR